MFYYDLCDNLMSQTDKSRTTQALSATNAIRETAKWLASAFAAVGAALLAGAQFSRIGSLGWGRLALAVPALVASLGCVLYALKIVTDILTPLEVTEADLSSSTYKEQVGKALEATLTGIKSAKELSDKIVENAGQHAKISKGLDDVLTPEKRAMLEARDRGYGQNQIELYELHDQLMASVAYWKLSDKFVGTRKCLYRLAIATTVGIGLFVWANSPSPQLGAVFVPKLNINLNGDSNLISNSVLDKIGAPIGPFQPGQSDRLAGEPSRGPSGICESDSVKSIVEKVQGKPLRLLLIIGSADKFELNSSLRAVYGSNEGLAQARADQILECLSKHGSSNVVLTTVRGPSVHGAEVKKDNTAADRSAVVYGIWTESSGRTQ